MVTRRLRIAAIAAGAAASIAGATVPFAAASPNPHHSAKVRAFDTHLLRHANHARTTNHMRGYAMNDKLWVIAHAWAKHLSKVGTLSHNPNLAKRVTKVCPNWTSIGENVGTVTGGHATTLFQAYMHSPSHRANILDKRYTQVGIATVKTKVNGEVVEWDVMDFGNHC
jgi:uncharacterized protein YkwD